MPSVSEAPRCLLCGEATTLLYASNVPQGLPLHRRELCCTSPYLAIHDDIFVCRDCGLARSLPPSGPGGIGDLYREVEDPDYLVSETERRSEFRRALELIEKRAPERGTLLEIGSAVGLFLDEARRRGWDAVGIEPSRWAAEAARAKGLNVFNGTVEEFEDGGRRFDVVASWDVLEHLEDPLECLHRARELLRPGGLLVFTTVNMGGLAARLLRGRWPWFMRMHLHYFTRESLSEVARRAGLEVLATSTQPKTLKLGYVLDRARGLLGPVASGARSVAEKLRLSERAVRIDLGDILWLEARKPERPGHHPLQV